MNKRSVIGWLGKVASVLPIVAAVSYVLAAYTTYSLRLIPNKYLLPALALGSIIMLVMLVVAWRGRRSGCKVKIAFSVVCVIIIAINAYVYSTGQATASLLSDISPAGYTKKSVDATKPFIIYISGIDSTDDPMSKTRSDVNILAVVNPLTHKILLVNTPRDYYVQLHGTTGVRDKLTHAGMYGVDMSRLTLQDLYGVEVPYYMRLNFSSLIKIVDTIGPITVYSEYDFKDYKKGYNTLNSTQALEFARERYSFEAGDRERGRNQQRVIEAIIAKLSEPSNILHYNSLLGTLRGSVQTNISEASLAALANRQLDDMKRWQVSSIAVDGTGATQPTYSMGTVPLYVMIPDQLTVDAAKQQITDSLTHK